MKSLRPQIYVSDWTGLSLQLYHDTEHYTNEERRHLFVMSVTPILVLMRARLGYDSQIAFPSECQALATLIEAMVECAQLCLEKGYRNCGAFVELPWLTNLDDLYQAAHDSGHSASDIPFTGDEDIRPKFLTLLRVLDKSLRAGLLTSAGAARVHLHRITGMVSSSSPEISAEIDPPETSEVADLLYDRRTDKQDTDKTHVRATHSTFCHIADCF